MLRHITRLVLLFALAFFATGESAALAQLRAPQNALAGQNIASGIFSETLAILRHLAASQAAELQQAKSTRGWNIAPDSPLATIDPAPPGTYTTTPIQVNPPTPKD